MRKTSLFFAVFFAIMLTPLCSVADTPPPGSVKVKGGTDGTVIGNVGDRLKVDAAITPSGTQNVNVSQIVGAAPSASNPLPFRLTDGISFYDARTRSWTLGFSTDKVDASGSSISISNFPGVQPVSGTVAVSNAFALDATLSSFSAKFNSLGQKLMAGSAPVVIASDQSAIPVSGPLTDAQLRAAPVPVSQSSQPLPTNAAQETGGHLATIDTSTASTATSASTIASQQTSGAQKSQRVDGSGNVAPAGDVAARGVFVKPTDGTNSQSYTASSEAKVSVTQPLPAGSNIVGNVRIDQTTPGTTNGVQVNAALPAGGNTIGTVNLGTIGGAATASNQTALGSQTTKVNDGINTMAVKAASTAPVATDPAAVVALSPNGNQAKDSSVTALQVAQGSTTSGQSGPLVQGAVTTNSPTYTTAQTNPVSLGIHGGQRVLTMGGDAAQIIRNDYSTTNVTTAAYTQLVASTSTEINRLHIFDSSGQDCRLATGAAASEVDQIQIPPGGWDQEIKLYIPAGTRISEKCTSATASSGILLVTGLK